MKQSSANAELDVLSPIEPQEQKNSQPAEDIAVVHLRLLWQQRVFLLKCAALSLLLATLIAFLIPKRYESTTRLMPPDDVSRGPLAMMAALGGNMPGGLGALAGDLLGVKSTGALFIGILTSRTVQDHLVSQFDLRRVYSAPTWETARKALFERTAISEDHKSGIITITVTDRDPQRAAAIAAEYAAELNSVVNQMSTSSARRQRVFLENRLTQVQHDLETAEREFGDFSSKNTAVNIQEQAKAMVGAAAALQGEIIASQAQLEGLRQIYSDSHVRVRSLRAHLSELQSQLNKVGGKDYVPGATEKGDSLYPSIRKLPVLGEVYADLYRRAKIQETVFEVLTQQYELAKMEEAKEIPSVKVLDAADVPERKSYPPRLLIMVLGGTFGFALAVVWVAGRYRWERIDSGAAYKILAREISESFSTKALSTSPTGSRLQSAAHKMWFRLAPLNGAARKNQPLNAKDELEILLNDKKEEDPD